MTKEVLEGLKKMVADDKVVAEYCAISAKFWTKKSTNYQPSTPDYDNCLKMVSQYGIQAQNTFELIDFMEEEIKREEAKLQEVK